MILIFRDAIRPRTLHGKCLTCSIDNFGKIGPHGYPALGPRAMGMSACTGPAESTGKVSRRFPPRSRRRYPRLIDHRRFYYGMGHNEMLIGEALKEASRPRHRVSRQRGEVRARYAIRAEHLMGGRSMRGRGGGEKTSSRSIRWQSAGSRTYRHLSAGAARSESTDPRKRNRCESAEIGEGRALCPSHWVCSEVRVGDEFAAPAAGGIPELGISADLEYSAGSPRAGLKESILPVCPAKLGIGITANTGLLSRRP